MDDAQEKPRPDPPREVAPRDDVHVSGSPVRCPFCHSDVAIEREWSACSRCLARHHQACWSEGGRCASCGNDGAVQHERAEHRLLPGRVAAVIVLLCAALALMVALVAAFTGQWLQSRSGSVVPAFTPPPPPVAEPRPASRYERDGALVVEDGRGSFVIVFEGEGEVAFGLGVTLESVEARQFVVSRPDGERWVNQRPLHYPLTVFEAPSTRAHLSRQRGLTAPELSELLRRTRPPDLDLAELCRRVRGS